MKFRWLTNVLSLPVIFELQQTLCNNYNDVGDEFSKGLAGDKLPIPDIGCATGKAASLFIDMVKQEYQKQAQELKP